MPGDETTAGEDRGNPIERREPTRTSPWLRFAAPAVFLMSAILSFLRFELGVNVPVVVYFAPFAIVVIPIARAFRESLIERSRGALLTFGGSGLVVVVVVILAISMLVSGQTTGAGQTILILIMVVAFVIAWVIGPLLWLLEWSGEETRRAVDHSRSEHRQH